MHNQPTTADQSAECAAALRSAADKSAAAA